MADGVAPSSERVGKAMSLGDGFRSFKWAAAPLWLKGYIILFAALIIINLIKAFLW